MIRRPLALALAIALLPVAGAHAEDLLQTYELARLGDPQLSAAESSRLVSKEGAVQARAALLPQPNGSASFNRTKSKGPSTQNIFAPSANDYVRISGESDTTSNSRRLGVNVDQVLFDFRSEQ